jgi:hypothetical protein
MAILVSRHLIKHFSRYYSQSMTGHPNQNEQRHCFCDGCCRC